MAYNNIFGTKKKNTVQDILEAQRDARAKQANMAANSYQQRLAAGDEYAGRDYALSVLGTFLGRKLAAKYKGESPEMAAARANDANVARVEAEAKARTTQDWNENREMNIARMTDGYLKSIGFDALNKPATEDDYTKARAKMEAYYSGDGSEYDQNQLRLKAEVKEKESITAELEQQHTKEANEKYKAELERPLTPQETKEMKAWYRDKYPGNSGMWGRGGEDSMISNYKREVLGIVKPIGKSQGKGGITPGGTSYVYEVD